MTIPKLKDIFGLKTLRYLLTTISIYYFLKGFWLEWKLFKVVTEKETIAYGADLLYTGLVSISSGLGAAIGKKSEHA